MTPYIIETAMYQVFVPELKTTLPVCKPCIEGSHLSYGIDHTELKDDPIAVGRCGCKNVPYEGSQTQCACNPHSEEIERAIFHFREALEMGRNYAQMHMQELGEESDASDFIGDNMCCKYESSTIDEVIKYIKEEQGW